MVNLTYKDIRYIRAALARELDYLETTTKQSTAGTLEPPLTDDEWSEMGDDILFYDKLLYWFEQWEKQSIPLQVVAKDGVNEENENGAK